MGESKRMPAFAKVAGMDRKGFEKVLRADPAAAVQAVAKGVAAMDPLKASDAMQGLGLAGVRTRAALLALGSTQQNVNKYMGIAAGEFREASALTQAYGINSEDASSYIEQLWNTVSVAADEFAKHLLPAIKGFTGGLSESLSDVRAWAEGSSATFATWGAGFAEKMRWAGVLWTNWGDFLELARIRTGEKLDQIIVIAGRFRDQLFANIEVMGQNVPMLLANIWDASSQALASVFEQSGGALGKHLVKGLLDVLTGGLAFDILPQNWKDQIEDMKKWLVGLDMDAKPIKPDFGGFAIKNLRRGLAPAPGIDRKALVRDLPNQDEAARPVEDRIRAARDARDIAAGFAGNAAMGGARRANPAPWGRGAAHDAAARLKAGIEDFDMTTAGGRRAAAASGRQQFNQQFRRNRANANRAARGLPPLRKPMAPPEGPPGGDKGKEPADVPAKLEALNKDLGAKLDGLVKSLATIERVACMNGMAAS